MKINFTLFLAVVGGLNVNIHAQSPDWLWAKRFGDSGQDDSKSIGIDAAQNIYTTGIFNGTVDFDPGPGVFNLSSAGMDIFIYKSDSAGNFIWAKQIGSASYDAGNGLAVDPSGNIYITGAFTDTVDFDPGPGIFTLISDSFQFEDIFVCKLDSSGNFIWAKKMGAPGGDSGNSIAIDLNGSGDIFVTGKFGGVGDFDPGAAIYNLTAAGDIDIFICRLDTAGNFVWAKSLGGAGTDFGNGLALDLSGNGDVYVTGAFSSVADFDPDAGIFNMTANGTWNTFIVKLNNAGAFVWARAFSGTAINQGYSIAVDFSGNSDVYITGNFSGSTDFDPGQDSFHITPFGSYDAFISKLDKSGNFVWAKQIGGPLSDNSYSMNIDNAGNNDIYITGSFTGTADFNPGPAPYTLTSAGQYDAYISKYDSSGSLKWVKRAGGTLGDLCRALTTGVNGTVYVTGYFFSPTVDFGMTILSNANGSGSSYDMFIAKLDSVVLHSGINNPAYENLISISPNPATDYIKVSAGSDKFTELTLTDIAGEIIFRKIYTSNDTEIDISSFSDGIYFISIVQSGFIVRKKIIIAR